MKNKIAVINSRKFDNKIHRSWEAEIISTDNSLLEFVGAFEKEIVHPSLGVIRRDTVSYEFYWLDRWYNIFRFHEPNKQIGDLRNFYCNINMPPTFNNNVLDYVDLDIDILVRKDFTYEILDLDEFEENTKTYSYSDDLRFKAEAALNELISMIENRIFPFDYQSSELKVEK